MGPVRFSKLFLAASSVIMLTNVIAISGHSTCETAAMMTVYSKACKYRRSHKDDAVDTGVQSADNEDTEKKRWFDETEIGSDEVLEIITNGIALVKELSDELRTVGATKSNQLKKEPAKENQEKPERRSNNIKRPSDDLLPEELTFATSLFTKPVNGVKMWRKLMRLRRTGGKFRRNSEMIQATFLKCCSHRGCSEKDFAPLCWG